MNRLKGILAAMERTDSVRLSLVEADLRKEMDLIRWQEETQWFQKSREQWVRFGDGNSKFFHTQTIVHRKRNRIEGMFLKDGSLSVDVSALQSEALGFFRDLFCSAEQTTPNCLVNLEEKSIDANCADNYTSWVTKLEVWEALKFMKSFTAPGPDGFQPFFFKYWHIVGDKVHDIARSAFRYGRFEKEITETLIVLIPKEDNPTKITRFSAISLCNVIYKLITKVPVNHLRPFLADFIEPLQSSFIPGRSTHDNVLVAQENHALHAQIQE